MSDSILVPQPNGIWTRLRTSLAGDVHTLVTRGDQTVSTSNPTPSDNDAAGFGDGAIWFNNTTGSFFVKVTELAGAAVWMRLDAANVSTRTSGSASALMPYINFGSVAYPSADRLDLYPFLLPDGPALQAIGLRIVTAGGTGSEFKFAVWLGDATAAKQPRGLPVVGSNTPVSGLTPGLALAALAGGWRYPPGILAYLGVLSATATPQPVVGAVHNLSSLGAFLMGLPFGVNANATPQYYTLGTTAFATNIMSINITGGLSTLGAASAAPHGQW